MDINPKTQPGSLQPDGYVIAGNGKLIEGQEYEIRNERKGTFKMRVTRIDGEWITGTITEGCAGAIMRYNVRDVGEEVTVRSCHSYFIPVGKTTEPTAEGALASAHCVNHHNYGCDPDATAEIRDIYEGDELLQTAHLCQACRAELIFSGLELIVPENDQAQAAGQPLTI